MKPIDHDQNLSLLNSLNEISRDTFFRKEVANAVSSYRAGEYENCLSYLDMAILAIERVPTSTRETVRYLRQVLNGLIDTKEPKRDEIYRKARSDAWDRLLEPDFQKRNEWPLVATVAISEANSNAEFE